ncbi:nucleoside hydrolase [bacterium]|nr:nucleoside hydrolase [bacterium]
MMKPSREEPNDRVVLDMDMGVDDAVALVLAMNSPEIRIDAITSVAGNAPVAQCTRNSLLITELIEPQNPPLVAQGASRPLARPLVIAPEVHGHDGLGGFLDTLPTPHHAAGARPAARVITTVPHDAPDSATLIATGPLTNLAAALRADPTAMASYTRIVIMGGAFDVPGNTGPVAEFNFYVDPEAAAVVLSAGLNITLVPLDATTSMVLTRAALESHVKSGGRTSIPVPARSGRNLAAILYRALDYYMAFQKDESGLDGGFMHDALAVAVALFPSIITTRPASVEVLTNGRGRGHSLMHAPVDGRTVNIACGLDEDAFRRILEERVLSPVWG